MPVALAVALGGALGSWLRYVLTTEVARHVEMTGAGTFVVNVTGAFVLGLLVGLLETRVPGTPRWVSGGLAIGVLGGYTTFSTYMIDAVHQLEDGRVALAVAYLAGSVALGLAMAFVGVWIGRQVG